MKGISQWFICKKTYLFKILVIFMNNVFAGKRGDEHILVGRKRWREENACRLRITESWKSQKDENSISVGYKPKYCFTVFILCIEKVLVFYLTSQMHVLTAFPANSMKTDICCGYTLNIWLYCTNHIGCLFDKLYTPMKMIWFLLSAKSIF